MTKWREILGKLGRPGVATGVQVPPENVPTKLPVSFSQFKGGLDLSASPENIPEDCGVVCLDMEVNNGGRLVRCPGVRVVEHDLTKQITGIASNADIDGFNLLYLISPPYIGSRMSPDSAEATLWNNSGIAALFFYPWATISVLGYLIFSNGVNKTYYVQNGIAGATDISTSVVAKCFGAAFGRVFAGGFNSGGLENSMGIVWNDSDGHPLHWNGLGSGAEILVPNEGLGDNIVRIAEIGFELLVVLCLNSVWFARETRIADRPADFRLQYSGIGCIAPDTVAVVDDGLIFLSRQGLVKLTPGSIDIISGAINDGLLPLTEPPTHNYVGTYDSVHRRYLLCTDTETWVYELAIPKIRPDRFYKRDYTALLTRYYEQNTGTGVIAGQSIGRTMLVTDPFTLSVEDYAVTLSNPLAETTPIWRTASPNKFRITDLFTTVGFEIQYVSNATATVKITTADTKGVFNQSVNVVLPSSGGAHTSVLIDKVSVGKGVATQIEILSGSPEIARITQFIEQESEGRS